MGLPFVSSRTDARTAISVGMDYRRSSSTHVRRRSGPANVSGGGSNMRIAPLDTTSRSIVAQIKRHQLRPHSRRLVVGVSLWPSAAPDRQRIWSIARHTDPRKGTDPHLERLQSGRVAGRCKAGSCPGDPSNCPGAEPSAPAMALRIAQWRYLGRGKRSSA